MGGETLYALDFEYDGQYLSDFGFIICEFGASAGLSTVSAGSNITFNKVPHNRGKKFSLTSTQYDKCIQTSFDICKNPDIYDRNDMEITNDEYKTLVRWLNRHEFLRFQVLYNDGRDTCYFDASFNIEKIFVSDILYGLRLSMETNRPFGYGRTITVSHTFTDIDVPLTILDVSDEIGETLPTITIKCTSDGDVKLFNELENCTTLIKNCKQGEIIVIDSQNQIISSNYNSHDIANDFNYEFFIIGNTYKTRQNNIYSSIQCEIKIQYEPIIKDTP